MQGATQRGGGSTASDCSSLSLRMAVEPKVTGENHDPFLGYGSLIVALVLLHLGVFVFWLWQVTGATARRPKVAQD